MGDVSSIAVLGGTGHYGSEIVRGLVARGARPRVLSRDRARARAALGEGVEVVEGDVRSGEAVAALLDGAHALVIAVSAFTWKTARLRHAIERDAVLAALELARGASVRRVVYLSGYDVTRDFVDRLGLLDFAKPMLDVQDALAASELDWTVLGCPPSMGMFFSMIRGETMTVPGGGPEALPTISPVDLGLIAADAALRSDLGGRRIRVAGPEALSFPVAARRIGAVWGRPIRFRAIPLAPITVAAFVTRPWNPYLQNLRWALALLNGFPPQLAAEAPKDHARLRELFDFEPTTLEAEADRRRPAP